MLVHPRLSCGLGWFKVDGNFVKRRGDGAILHDGAEDCGSLEEALVILEKKTQEGKISCHKKAYMYDEDAKQLYMQAVDHGAEWSSVQPREDGSKGVHLFVWGTDTKFEADGLSLIKVDGVDCCGGDGDIDYDVTTFDQAVETVKSHDKQMTYCWHEPSGRLIEKPTDNDSHWTSAHGEKSLLFMWGVSVLDCSSKL